MGREVIKVIGDESFSKVLGAGGEGDTGLQKTAQVVKGAWRKADASDAWN